MGCSQPGSSVPGISQARMLEWVAMPSPGDLPNQGLKLCLLCLLYSQAGILPLVPHGKHPLPPKNVFNSKFFSLLTQREVKGVDGKCSFCENTGSCILGPFYDLSRRRKHCHLLLFFNHSIPSSFQHATNLLGFPLSTKVHHSEEKLEIQKITSPASPEGQKEKFSLLPLLFSAISIY